MIGEGLPSHRQRRCPAMFAVFAILFSLAASPALAQDRGAVTGRVVDSSGGVLPGVSVTVVNTATNATTGRHQRDRQLHRPLPDPRRLHGDRDAQRLQDRQTGRHHRPRRRSRRHRLHAGAGGDRGTVVVTAAPVLETGTATMGQVIDAKLISEIPLGDGTAYGLTRLIPGATFERSYALQRPMDNDNLRGMTVTGTISSEFSIDGSSNVVSQARARHPAAGRGDPGIQGRNRRLRRADRPHRRRQREPRAQERHQPVQPRRLLLQPRRLAIGKTCLRRIATTRGKTIPRLQPLQRHRIGPDLQEQDVLHGVVREAAGRHGRVAARPRCRPRRCATATSPSCSRPACSFTIRSRRARRAAWSRATRFTGNIIPHEPAQSDRAQRPEVLPAAERRHANADLQNNFFVDQPWTYGYNFPMVRVDHEWSATSAPTAAGCATSAAKSGSTSPACRTASTSRRAARIAST